MRFKKTVKRIVALGTGASMVGATIFGAMAADLSAYPTQYIKDGKFTGILVVGDGAAAEDVVGMSDIMGSLQFAATKPAEASGSTETASGDAWKVATSTKILELSQELSSGDSRETLRNITTFIDDGELDALGSGTVSSNKGDAPYNQYLYLLGPGADSTVDTGYVQYAEDDQDVTADFLYFKTGRELGRYMLEFTTALESDVDDSAGTATSTGLYLTDYEDVDMTMMGRTYSIVQARRTSATTNGGKNIKLVLMSGSTQDTLQEGDTKTYTIDETDYEVTLDFVSSTQAKFTVNGEATRLLKDGDTDKLSDGLEVGVSEILYQDYAGGVHSTTFYLGAQKLELKDTDVSDVASSNSLKVADDTIDDATVIIEATNDNSTFKINRIHINMTADDDFYVPAGGKLSENPDLDEPEVLFTTNWDYEYRGLSDEPIEEIEITTSGNKRYKLKFKDGDGEEVSLPLAEATAASVLEYGEKGKALISYENQSVQKDDYIILTDTSENRGERKTYVLQYKGADKVTADSPVLKFKDLGDGDTIEQTYSNVSDSAIVGPDGTTVTELATLKIGGADHKVYALGGISANDFRVLVDLNAQNDITSNATDVNITTWYGMEIGIQNTTITDTSNGIAVSFKTPDNTREGGTTQDNVESLQSVDYVVNITSDSNSKVTFGELTAHTSGQDGRRLSLRTPDGETDVSYGYTSYGAFITVNSPTSDPNTLKIEYPKAQREALVYVTAKGTTFSAAAAASSGAVSVQRIDVGASKLASEVADINAQNSILVGGPCVNKAAATVMGTGADCTAGFTPGVGKIQIWEVGDGNVAMLVAGYAAADTRNAAAVVANYGDHNLKGAAMEVTKVGSTLTVAEPSAAAPAEEEAMEESMEESDDAAAE